MTTTTRLGITEPATSDSMKKGDSVIADAWLRTDLNIGLRPVAAFADITSPYTGQFAYNTTSTDGRFYNGAWKYWTNPKAQRGIENYITDSSSGTTDSTSAGATKVLETNINCVTGRIYLITVTFSLLPSTNTANYTPTIAIKYNTSAVTTSGSPTLITHAFAVPALTGGTRGRLYSFTQLVATAAVGTGDKYFGMWLDTVSGTISTTWRGHASTNICDANIMITDMGTL